MSTRRPVLDADPDADSDAAAPSDVAQERADRRADRRHALVVRVGQIGVGVLFLVAWELLSGRVVDEFFLSKPSLIGARILDLAVSGELWGHLGTTLLETGLGLAIGLPLGIVLGIVLALSTTYGQWFYPYVIALYSLPRVALAPLFIVWFGIGLFSKVVMVVTMVLFVAFYNVYQGVKSIDRDPLDMARSYRASRWTTLRWVLLPAIGPWMFTATRLAIGLALIGAVIAEIVGANVGLGYYIRLSSNLFDTTGVFAGIIVVTVVAMVLEQIVVLLEKRVLRYR